jgi:hypothetical protein
MPRRLRRLASPKTRFRVIANSMCDLHLGEETVQQSEVASRHPDDRRNRFLVPSVLGKMDIGRRPSPVQQLPYRAGIQGLKLMYESDPGIELRVACEAFLEPWHSESEPDRYPRGQRHSALGRAPPL